MMDDLYLPCPFRKVKNHRCAAMEEDGGCEAGWENCPVFRWIGNKFDEEKAEERQKVEANKG